MIMSEQIDEIAKALGQALFKIDSVKKTKQAHGYKYAELVDCLEMIKEPLAQSELALTQIANVEYDKTVLITMIMHSSGQWIRSTFPLTPQGVDTKEGKNRINEMQSLGSGITYLRRYAICAMLGIAQEDDDGAKSSGEKVEPAKPAPKPKVEPAKPKVHPSVKSLKDLCEKNNIDLKEFANTFGIVSTDIPKVDESVKNFQDLLELYKDKKNNIIEDVLP